MKLTNEQLEQCRKDFVETREKIIMPELLTTREWALVFLGFQAAWRPIPSVGEIEAVLNENLEPAVDGDCYNAIWVSGITPSAQAIRRAFGGKK